MKPSDKRDEGPEGGTCGIGRDACLATRAAAGDVRILHRLRTPVFEPIVEQPGTRLGLVVDVETTGLRAEPGSVDAGSSAADEIIELAAVPFTYRRSDGAVLAVHAPFTGLRQPSTPIPKAVEAITGLTDEMVRGRDITRGDVDAAVPLDEVAIVISHNASFDSSFLRRFEPLASVFSAKPWACTIEDAAWAEVGIASSKLEFVAAFGFGLFYPPHRAEVDCLVLVEILGRTMPGTQETVLAKILRSARNGRHRVQAFMPLAAAQARAAVKARRYRWDPGESRHPKCWWLDVWDEEAAAAERTFLMGLESFADQGRVEVGRLTAYDRF